MLSYMVPSNSIEKPPVVPVPAPVSNRAQLQLHNLNGNHNMGSNIPNGHATVQKTSIKTPSANSMNGNNDFAGIHTPSSDCISKTENIRPAYRNNNSVSSLSLDAEKLKTKSTSNGTAKQTTLKRVSFGSSKGSMVETLIYDAAQEESDFPVDVSTRLSACCPSVEGTRGTSTKVRVSFYESQKPLTLLYANNRNNMMERADYHYEESYDIPSSPVISTVQSSYRRQQSTDSGWENPFRPGGDLSKEADEIVELIKGGKPITPTQGVAFPKLPGENGDIGIEQKDGGALLSSSPKAGNSAESKPNGNVMNNSPTMGPGVAEVQVGVVAAPADASQVEHVILKKKRKCQCCVIQ